MPREIFALGAFSVWFWVMEITALSGLYWEAFASAAVCALSATCAVKWMRQS